MKKIVLCALATFVLILSIEARTLRSQPSSANGFPTSNSPLGIPTNPQAKLPANKDSKDAAEKNKDQPNTIEGYQTKNLWREGARVIQMTGQFQVNGETTVQFTSSDGKLQIIAVPNLMLQRVHQTITETADVKDHDWVINGIITEYRNANFIILTHAILKTKNVQKDLAINKAATAKPQIKSGANP